MAKKKSRVGKAVTYKEFKKQNMPVDEVYASGRPVARMHAGAAKNRGPQSRIVDAPIEIDEAGMGAARKVAISLARKLAKSTAESLKRIPTNKGVSPKMRRYYTDRAEEWGMDSLEGIR